MRSDTPPDRWRVGLYGIAQLIGGLGGTCAVVALDVSLLRYIDRYRDAMYVSTRWAWYCLAASAVVLLLMVWLGLLGLNTRRPVRLVRPPEGEPALLLPRFSLLRFFHHRTIPLADIADVELTFRARNRDSRWHLAVTLRDGSTVTCDSISSIRPFWTDRRRPAAHDAVAQIRAAVTAYRAEG